MTRRFRLMLTGWWPLLALLLAILLAVIAAVALGGCSTPYRVEARPDGTVIAEGTQDPKATAPPSLTVTRGEDGSTTLAWEGASRQLSRGEIAAVQLRPAMWLGLGLIVLGAASFVARMYLPIIPTSATTTCLIAGGALIAAAVMLPQIPWWVMAAAGVAVVVIVFPGVLANRKAAAPAPVKPTEPTA